MVVGLFVGVWVARYLGPSQFGLLSYAQAFVGLFTAFATLGLDGIVVRELVKDESKKDELLGTAFWLKLIGAIIMMGFIAIAVQFTSNDHYTNILVFIVASATIFQAFNVIDFYFQAKVLGKYIALANSITLCLSSIVKIALILYRAPLIAFVWAVVFDSVILALGYLYFYLKLVPLHSRTPSTINYPLSTMTNNPSPITFHPSHFTFHKKIAIDLLKDSWPLIFGSLSATIYMRIDQVMVKEMLNTTAAGYYAVAVKLSDIWLFITVTITQSLMPAIINAKKVNEKLYLKRIQMQYDLLVKVAAIIAIIITIFADRIINLLFGNAYIPSVPVLQVYVWSIIFVFLSNGSWAYYLNENLQTIAGLRLVYGAIANIVLNYFLIQIYGLKGAAIATLISYSLSSYFVNAFYPKTKKNFILQTKALLNICRLNRWNFK